jgi:hypothetical protein
MNPHDINRIVIREKTESKQTLEKIEGAIKNRPSKETGNIGYTGYWTKTNKKQ